MPMSNADASASVCVVRAMVMMIDFNERERVWCRAFAVMMMLDDDDDDDDDAMVFRVV